MTTSSADTALAGAVQNAIAAWQTTVGQLDKALGALSDSDLQREVAPGRNRVFYLVGHLAAVHDRLLPLLRLGDRKYNKLDAEFLVEADRAQPASTTTAAEVRAALTDANARLATAFATLKPEEWFERHDSVSPEDFATNPLRNRLAVLLSRTNHVAMHEGQVRLAVPRS